MAKKKKKNKAAFSPKNYVANQARNLPIAGVFINPDWREDNLANILVAREHTNGHITVGIYLVDLFCLGLKDTIYEFNIPRFEFEEKYRKSKFAQIWGPCSYELAHNIIYGGIEYAEELGLQPHRDWRITQGILEEDDEKVELMDIEFGDKGVPHLIIFEGQNYLREMSVLSKTLGPGNFLVSHLQVDQDEDWDEEEDFFDDEEEDFEMDFSHPDPFQWTSDDWAIFLEDEEVLPFPVYARAIDCLYRLSDKEATVNTDGWEEEYKKFVPANFEISGIVDPEDEDEYVESINLFASVAGAGKNLLKKIKKLFHNHPENEILREIILEFLLTEFDAKDAGPLAREFFQSFPESIGAKTKMAEFLIRVGDLDGAMEIMGGSFSLVKLFPGQQKFTGMELMHVLDLAIFYYVTKFEISKATMYSEWEWNLFAGNGVNLSGLRAITDFKESQMPDLRVIIEGLESEGKIR